MQHMTATSKRIAFVAGCTILGILAVTFFIPGGNSGFQAESLVMARSYTNAFFTRSFEASVMKASPSIVRLRVMSPKAKLASTNGAVIRITATGSTAKDAQRSSERSSRPNA